MGDLEEAWRTIRPLELATATLQLAETVATQGRHNGTDDDDAKAVCDWLRKKVTRMREMT